MIIDCHAHLEEEIPAEEMIRIMDRDGVSRSVVFAGAMESIPSIPDLLLAAFRFLLASPLNPGGRAVYNRFVREGNLLVSGKAYRIHRDPDNAAVAEAAVRHPHRLIFFAFLNPRGTQEPLEVLEACRTRCAVRGVKAHAWFHQFDPSRELLPVAHRCEELDLPLLIHLGGSARTGNVEGLLAACPRLKVILAHAGIPYFGRIWPLLGRYPNLHMDLSGPYLNAALVRRVVAAVGPERLLFGTDAPYGLRSEGGHGYAPMKRWTEALPITDAEKEAIFSGNLVRLLGE